MENIIWEDAALWLEYYMREKVVENDAKGIGPLILAYIEYKSTLEG